MGESSVLTDAMDDKFGHWNWTKLVRLGTFPTSHTKEMDTDLNKGSLLAKKYLNTAEQAKFHMEELLLINNGLPVDLVRSWTMKITTWENNRSAPNPYYTTMIST